MHDHLNSDNFQPFLDELSQQLGHTGAVMPLNGALAHRAKN